ncbi:HEPN domain-containing protein [Conyzicola sp.]|uniref:HEPN domain-containing protein n=1 Tax=Conyzicola sp. TaxID=1969404 RepID=UPI00398962F8
MTRGAARFVDRRSSIKQQLAEIDTIILLAGETDDLVARVYLELFAVVRLSGFIESSVGHMVHGYLEENAAHRVQNFGKRQTKRLPSMTPENLEQLVSSFDSDWAASLTEYLAKDENRQTLSNLIGARHALAHGSTTNVSGSLLRQYHRVAESVVQLLEDMFIPLK